MTTTVHTESHKNADQQQAPIKAAAPSTIPVVPKLRLDEVKSLKEQIKDENAKLFKMQALVLQATWDSAVPVNPNYIRSLSARAAKVEDHISALCMQLKTARAVEDGSDGFEAWRKGQEAVAKNLEERVGKSSDPRAAQALAQEAHTLEKEAELMVQELKANLQRGDTREFASWEKLHAKELGSLESELAETRRAGKPCHGLLLQIKACHQDMRKIRLEAAELSQGSSADSSDSEDDGGEYEGLAILRLGDKVRLIGDAEDGFARGDKGLVAEVDHTIAYPYRVTKAGADGWFKAIDLELVERKHPVALRVPKLEANPISPKAAAKGSPNTVRAPTSPYHDTPYASESSGEEGYECYEDVDLEKGRSHCSGSAAKSLTGASHGDSSTAASLQSFLKSCTKDVACTLNPLAQPAQC